MADGDHGMPDTGPTWPAREPVPPAPAPEDLRDRFAMAALTGVLANPEVRMVPMATSADADGFAKSVYAIADAMMKARQG